VEPGLLDPRQPGAFRLGEWLVEPSLNRVSRGDTAVKLELKVMEVLVCLARHAPTVVSKTELIDTVWQTEFISVNTLTHAIAELRRVFSDDARNPRFIETITKRGYRLMVPVEVETPPPQPVAVLEPLFVVVLDGRETALPPGVTLIGRASDAAIRINNHMVSRHHARIVVDHEGATLEDLGSKNGTQLWGEPVTGPTRLRDGDEIAVGPSILVFHELAGDGTTRTAVRMTGDRRPIAEPE
jgi:DNA-binding winged helix-turn-helix (wHTH) protein